MKWTKTTLGELVADDRGLVQTGPFGSSLHQSDYTDDGIPVIMPTNISDGRVSQDAIARIPEHTAQRLERHKLKPRTIVLPRRGEITKRAFIREDQEGWVCGSGCLKIEVHDTDVVPEFLYYYMAQHDVGQWLEQHAVGSTMLNLSAGIVNDMPVQYPGRNEQLRIADTLTAYDDLVENNRRRMALLEESARLLYREWFVHLRFPGHEKAKQINGVPKGWQRVPLGEMMNLQRGHDLPSQDREEGEIPIVSSSGITGFHDKKKADAPGVVTGRYGTLGQVYYIDRDYWPLNTALYVTDFKGNPPLFVLHLLKHALESIQSDKAAIPGLNRNVVHSMKVLSPPQVLRNDFRDFAADVYRQISTLNQQTQKLRSARDLLLPRLMSGEIIV